MSSPPKAPLPGHWFLWFLSLGFGAFLTLLAIVFSSDDPSASRFFSEYGLTIGFVAMGAVAITGLLSMIQGKLHVAVILNLGQIVAIPTLLAVLSLVL